MGWPPAILLLLKLGSRFVLTSPLLLPLLLPLLGHSIVSVDVLVYLIEELGKIMEKTIQ